MIALIQRVTEANVTINGELSAEIGRGFLVLLGVAHGDTQADSGHLAKKTANLRVFQDEAEKMNLSLTDVAGSALVISQFTLCADTRKGNRPSFIKAAPPDEAIPLYEHFVAALRQLIGDELVKTGEFGADMKISLVNDGPVTINLSTSRE